MITECRSGEPRCTPQKSRSEKASSPPPACLGEGRRSWEKLPKKCSNSVTEKQRIASINKICNFFQEKYENQQKFHHLIKTQGLKGQDVKSGHLVPLLKHSDQPRLTPTTMSYHVVVNMVKWTRVTLFPSVIVIILPDKVPRECFYC